MNVSAITDHDVMTPHELIANLTAAKQTPEYGDYLATTTVALAHRGDLEPLAAVLDELVSHYDPKITTTGHTRWTYDNTHGWIDA